MHLHDKHTMVLAAEYPDGSQVWSCPECGRRLLMSWPPNHSRSILEEGDPNAEHSGVHYGEISSTSVEPALDSEQAELDDPYLAPFVAWMEDYER